MESNGKTSINNAPKAFRMFLIFLPVIGIFLIKAIVNNDFYFIYPTGEYIINNGFPVKDILSMHTGMNIIVQQWLCDVLFYSLYSKFGAAGLYAFMYICYAVIAVLIYKLNKLICENEFVSAASALLADIVIAFFYAETRPQMVSYIVFLAEIYVLEKYYKTENKKLLIILPFLSLFLINFHASMWLLFFIFALPFVAEALPINIKKLNIGSKKKLFIPLLITGAVCFVAGFLNPYGTGNMKYGLLSFGKPELHELVSEMRVTGFDSPYGVIFYLIIIAFAFIIIFKKTRFFAPRHVLMFAGTAVLAVSNIKSVAFFILLGIPAFTYFIKDFDPKIKMNTESSGNKGSGIVFAFVIVIACALSAFVNTTLPTGEILFPQNKQYDTMDKITDILDNETGEIVLYSGIDCGPYLEFLGYHPYIDCRIEMFFKSNNGEYDYLSEYIDVCKGKTDYRSFVDKYGFNYLLLVDNEKILLDALKNDSDFELVTTAKTNDTNANKYLFKRK